MGESHKMRVDFPKSGDRECRAERSTPGKITNNAPVYSVHKSVV